MTEAPPTMPADVSRCDRRIYVWWAVGLGLFLAAALGGPRGTPAHEAVADARHCAASPGTDGPAEPDGAPDPADDFSPGQFAFLALALAVLLVLLALVVFLALIILGITAFLIALGVISTSALTGLAARSPRSGFKAFFLQAGGLGGALCGAAVGWLVTLTGLVPAGARPALVIGGIVGLAFGAAGAAVFNRVWGAVLDWLLARFRRRQGSA